MPLVRDLRAAVLVISDVVGDDLTSIGSGPLTPDPTTFGEALEVLSRYDLVRRVPESVRRALDGTSGVALLAGGTDGTDGPTDAAGAVVDGGSWARASELGLEPAAALARNDSWTVFDRTGELLRTGPTGTNVMDLMIGLTPGVRGDGSRSYHPHRKHRSDAGMTEFRKTSGT